ncbi:S41 family peptidase [Streptomyces sp. NRRL B-24720]|uniref:S41 family peptidase n=1 Tax=Streptomyces sp. NRRL B-24720 TaxID=1476876 RepID=UPI000A5106B8|nr:S41 family peptidase [Streptomyces sp. NRRL B-24720]
MRARKKQTMVWCRLMAVTAALVVTAGCTAEAPSPGEAMSPKARNYLTKALDIMERNSLLSAEVDWTAVRRGAFDRAGTAQTPAETYGAVRQALRDLEDQHSQFMDPDQTRLTMSASAEEDVVPPEGRMLADDIGYLSLPPVPSDEAADNYVRQARAAISKNDEQGACGWVIDLRSNWGGTMWGPLAAVGSILGDGDTGAFVEADGKKTVWTVENGTPSEYLDDWGPAQPLSRPMPPVAVLTSHRTRSAAEAVTIAFRGRPDTRSFGEPTSGAPTANVYHRLSDGAAIFLTQAREADRTGHVYNGPITPDLEIHDDARNLSSHGDQVLMAATRWLSSRPDCRQ